MKTILKYFALAVILLALNSCENFLDTKPENFIQPEQYMTNEKEAFAMLTAVYDPLSRRQLWGQTLATYAQTDDLYFQNGTGTDNQLYTNNPTSADYRITDMWNYLYIGIERANQFLAQIDKPVMAEENRIRYKGEAQFLRAFYYFTLVQQFGGVPLRLTPFADVNKVQLEKSPASEVLKQVVKDMEEAVSLVGSAFDNNLIGARVTQSAVQGILARVYLTMAGAMYTDADFNKKEMYEKALYWAYQVKKSDLHKLNNKTVIFDFDDYGGNGVGSKMGSFEYMDTFRKLIADEFDTEFRESIWEVVGSGNSENASNQEYTSFSPLLGAKMQYDVVDSDINTHPGWYSYGSFSTTTTIWNLFHDITLNPRDAEDVPDLRRNTSCLPYMYGTLPNVTVTSRKDIVVSAYLEPGSTEKKPQYFSHKACRPVGKFNREFDKSAHNKNNSSCNFPLLRYSDVLLMIAESALQVQALGGTVPSGIIDVNAEIYNCVKEVRDRARVETPLSKITLDFIKEERARELCFEGLRRQDLLRWGDFLKAYTTTSTIMNGSLDVTSQDKERFGFCAGNLEIPKIYLLPIPSKELSVNKLLEQNFGW